MSDVTCMFCGGTDLDLVHDEEGHGQTDRFYHCNECTAETVTRNGRDPELALDPQDLVQVSDLLRDLRSA